MLGAHRCPLWGHIAGTPSNGAPSRILEMYALDKAIDMLHRQRVVIHLQATFFTAFGKPIN